MSTKSQIATLATALATALAALGAPVAPAFAGQAKHSVQAIGTGASPLRHYDPAARFTPWVVEEQGPGGDRQLVRPY